MIDVAYNAGCFVVTCGCGFWASAATLEFAGRQIDVHLAECFPLPSSREPCPGGGIASLAPNLESATRVERDKWRKRLAECTAALQVIAGFIRKKAYTEIGAGLQNALMHDADLAASILAGRRWVPTHSSDPAAIRDLENGGWYKYERLTRTDDASAEARVADWIMTRIGAQYMHPRERAMRVLEEAIELAQAEKIPIEMVRAQVDHVYARPAGDPEQEAGGVAVCLTGWCASSGLTLQGVLLKEIERIENKPIESIRGSLARKDKAGMITVAAQPSGSEDGELK